MSVKKVGVPFKSVLSTSQKFVDSNGDGLMHRSAWAGAGNGVLFYDANGDGVISEDREYIFTKWDPTATSDLEALRAAFDKDGDGKLSGAELNGFKVEVTNANGTTSVQTLAELGITEINLIGDATEIMLPDGSTIQGQTTYTRSDGSTGTVANATLVAEVDGKRVVQSTGRIFDGPNAGQVTIISTGYNADGSIAFTIKSVTNGTATLTTNSYDDNGDGVVDRLQTITRVTNGDGSKTETRSNYSGSDLATAVVVNSQVTLTSADNKLITINRDATGGGWVSQKEVQTTNPDGSRSDVITDFAKDGVTVVDKLTKQVSVGSRARDINRALDGNADNDNAVRLKFGHAA